MTETKDDNRAAERAAMVAQLRHHGITNAAVLEVMGRVRRHRFIPEPFRKNDAYDDHPCPIGHDQTISQPFIVAYMTERIGVTPGMKILEIGTGSGYQAAVLAALGADVRSIEIVAPLADHARAALAAEGFPQVQVRTGDGYLGWPEAAPFDAIIVTCAPEEVPQALVDGVRDGGRLILPVGPTGAQRLITLRKTDSRLTTEDDVPVRFVPMVHGTE